MFSLICAWINGWVNNRKAVDLRRHRANYDVTVNGHSLLGVSASKWRPSIVLICPRWMLSTVKDVSGSTAWKNLSCQGWTLWGRDYQTEWRTPPMMPSENCHGPLTRYVKLWVAHAPGMPGTFSPPLWVNDPGMHRGRCVTHLPWCMPGSLTSVFRWWGKRSLHSRSMCNPQFGVSGKRPMMKSRPGRALSITGPLWGRPVDSPHRGTVMRAFRACLPLC